MSEKLAFEIFYIQLYHILAIFLLICVNYAIFLKAKKSQLLYNYLAVQLCIFIWMLSKVFKTVSPNVNIRWFFIVTQYFGNCFLGSTFLMFSYLYATGKNLKTLYLILINIISVFFFLTMATNPLHMKFYSHYDFYSDSFGTFFYAHQFYTYVLILMGLFLCAKNFSKQFKEQKMQSRLFAIGILMPLIINVFYIFKLFKIFFGFRPLFDITPIVCTISLILFAIAIFKYNFFDIIHIARDIAIHQLPHGVALFDNKNTQLYSNITYSEFINSNKIIKQIQLPIYFKNKKIGTSLQLIDISKQQEQISIFSANNLLLTEANEKLKKKLNLTRDLSISKTRSHIAREVHDILGHSIVLAISILEVSFLDLNKDISKAHERIQYVFPLLKNSLKDVENSIMENHELNNMNKNLLQNISNIKNDVSKLGVTVEITIQGKEFELGQEHKHIILRICQEGITNAIKHGKASIIDIIFRFLSYSYEIYLIDNGIGCTNLSKGNGLSGMEKRLSELNGKLKYSSCSSSGFNLHLTVPINPSTNSS
jgi:signal transduction histidine kinase